MDFADHQGLIIQNSKSETLYYIMRSNESSGIVEIREGESGQGRYKFYSINGRKTFKGPYDKTYQIYKGDTSKYDDEQKNLIPFLNSGYLSYLFIVSILLSSCNKDKEVGYFEDDTLRYEVELKNGKRHGKLVQFYHNGTTEIISKWQNGKKHGEAFSYYRNGKIRTKERFINDRADGKFIVYDSLGNVEEEIIFIKGRKEGEYLGYYPSGDTMIVGNYQNDKKHGKVITFYNDGSIKDKQIFIEDSLVYNVSHTKGGAFYNESVLLSVNFKKEAKSVEISLMHSFYNSTRIGVALGDLDSSGRLIDTTAILGSKGTTINYPLKGSEESKGWVEGILYEIDMPEDIIKAQMPFKFRLR